MAALAGLPLLVDFACRLPCVQLKLRVIASDKIVLSVSMCQGLGGGGSGGDATPSSRPGTPAAALMGHCDLAVAMAPVGKPGVVSLPLLSATGVIIGEVRLCAVLVRTGTARGQRVEAAAATGGTVVVQLTPPRPVFGPRHAAALWSSRGRRLLLASCAHGPVSRYVYCDMDLSVAVVQSCVERRGGVLLMCHGGDAF